MLKSEDIQFNQPQVATNYTRCTFIYTGKQLKHTEKRTKTNQNSSCFFLFCARKPLRWL